MNSESQYRYFPVSPDDEKWGLYITTCGHRAAAPGSPHPSEQHLSGYHSGWEKGRVLPVFTMVYILHGSGVFESRSSGNTKISEGALFLVQPGEWHRYRPVKKIGWTEYWVGFSGSYALSIASGFFSTESPVVNAGADEDILESYLRILDLSESQPVGFQQIMAGHTMTILGHFYQNMKGRGTALNEADAIIQKAKCSIIENLAKPLDQKALALELKVGHSWLRRTFKHYTVLPLLQYQLQMRINKAQGLIMNSDLPVYTIANQCGFESCYYFSRMFKNKTGIAPSTYRNQCRQGCAVP